MSISEIPVDSSVGSQPGWWRSAVVYQVYPRSFQDSDGDGVGDLRGIISRLDHLQQLGVDVIWVSPFYCSPQSDNGYDVSDYQSIDPVFGTIDDFDELLAQAHARGMKLIIDIVVNHTSDEHAWFQESRSSRNNARRDWYWWRPARDGAEPGTPGAEPTNWESFFSGPTWTWDEATGEYYLHLFDRKQPDLNWENPEVRGAVHSMMRWWLERGVDGFRMDVINLVSKQPGLPDGRILPGRILGDGFPHYSCGPRIHEFMQELRRDVCGNRDVLIIGEMPGVTTEEAERFTDPARGELDMVFQFEHVGLDHGNGKFDPRPLTPGALAASLTKWQEALADKGWNSLYLANHDQPRSVSRFGDDRQWWRESATALATALHLLRGTPFVYQGEELGMVNTAFRTLDEFRDLESLNYAEEALGRGVDAEAVLAGLATMGRDNARTPVQWDASPNAGFSSATPWIPANPNHTSINADSQYGVPGSVFEHYRALIDLRHRLPVISDGTFRRLDASHPDLFVYERALGDQRLLVEVNLSGEELAPVLTDAGEWADVDLLLSNRPDGRGVNDVLRAWEARVYGNQIW